MTVANRFKIVSIRKLRPYDPIDVHIPSPGAIAWIYRRYENGTWVRSSDSGKTFEATTSTEAGLLTHLLILWSKTNAT